jgi:hypothetical protein
MKKNHWAIRRKIIILAIVFCALSIAFVLFGGVNDTLGVVVVKSGFLAATAIITTYCSMAVWDDKKDKKK